MTEQVLSSVPVFGKAAAKIAEAGGGIAEAAYRATTSSTFSEICRRTDNILKEVDSDLQAADNQVTKSMTDTPSSVQTPGRSKPLGRPDLRELQGNQMLLLLI